jgi:hypothetical protein
MKHPISSFVLAVISVITIYSFSETFALQNQPATARQAAAILDFSEFPLIKPIDEASTQTVARQTYRTNGTITEIAEQLRAKLKEAGCEELPGATFMDAYGSAVYQKDGFKISLTLSPLGQPNEIMVNFINHGNVDLKELPVPAGGKEMYALPSAIAYTHSGTVEETSAAYKDLLLEKGWEPFGETTVSFFVKKNAVILQVMVSASPQDNSANVQINSELMSVDLPAPPYTGVLQYSETAGNILFDSEKSQAELIEFFKSSLGELGWSATTENPIKIGFREHLIFRNPEKEYLELDFQTVEDKTRTRLKYQTAKQFAEMEKRAQEKLRSKQQ